MGKITIDGKEYDFKAHHTNIQLEQIKIKVNEDISFRKVFQKNMTEGFMQDMFEVINPLIRHEENSIWNVRGSSGSGKSLAVMSLAKKFTPKNFSYKNVVFYDQQILDLAKDTPRDSFLIRDEAVDTYGVGSNRITSDMVTLSETCRKAGINLAFLSPSERHIPVAKIILDVVDRDYTNRITRIGLKDPELNRYLGAVYIKVLDNDDYDWIMYNKAKDEFIESIKSGKRAGGKGDYKSLALEMAKKIDCDNFRSKKQRLAYLQAELTNLTRGEIEIVATFMEIVIENGEEALDDINNGKET